MNKIELAERKLITCPICKNKFFTRKPDNYQCRKCGARFEQV